VKVLRSRTHHLAALCILCLLATLSSAQGLTIGDVVYVDFGASSTTTPDNWNNITTGGGSVTDAITNNGIVTGISITLPDPFNGVNESGTTEPDAALEWPGTATQDNLYGNDVEWSGLIVPTAQLVYSGLEPGLSYEWTVFCSRMGVSDNRQTEYAITGAGGLVETLYLDPANNVDTQTVSGSITPTEDGQIIIDMKKGPDNTNSYGFFYIGCCALRVVRNLSAVQPNPADGANDVRPDAVLSWTPGQLAATHDVYFGTVLDDVTNADRSNPLGVLVGEGQTDATFDPPGELELGQTYYWRVDEVNGAPDYSVYKGAVWTFTAEPFAYIAEGVVATSNAVSEADRGPENVVNGSGLNDNDEHSIESGDMWSATAPDDGSDAYIQFEFAQVRKLYEMLVWNYSFEFESFIGIGLKDVTVAYSIDGTDWTVLSDVTLAQGIGASNYTANTVIPLEGVAAKYVRLSINSAYGTTGRYGLSEVRFLYTPASPREPLPTDGATDVAPETVLSWRPGRGATSHEVYLGTDAEADAAGEPTAVTTEPTYAAGPFDYGQTYYWQVVEINDDLADEAWEGGLWSFSTQKYLVIDDFDSYIDDETAGDVVWEIWIDGLVEFGGDPANGGSQVGHNTSPFAEQTIVRSGQSMPLYYDNPTASAISEADRTLSPAQDWSVSGIKSLSLWFAGAEGNTGQLYVKINDVKVSYDGDADDISKAVWQPWNIDLSAAGANLSSVTMLTVGVEGAGSGVVYIDEIRLYPKEADMVNLVGYYALEGNAADSSGSGNDGVENGGVVYDSGLEGQAVHLDGVDDCIVVAGTGVGVGSSRTISGWAKADTTDVTAWTNVFGFTGPSGNNGHFDIECVGDTDNTTLGYYGIHRYGWERDIIPIDLEWHHLAATYDGITVAWYGDGQLIGSEEIPADQIAPPGQVHIGKRQDNTEYFAGSVDEVRIYDIALSAEELAGL